MVLITVHWEYTYLLRSEAGQWPSPFRGPPLLSGTPSNTAHNLTQSEAITVCKGGLWQRPPVEGPFGKSEVGGLPLIQLSLPTVS